MRILPKSKFTWILIIFIIYIYYEDYAQRHPHYKNPNVAISQNKEDPAVDSNNVDPENDQENQTIKDKFINTIRQNDTANTVLEALAKKAAEDKYGQKEIREVVANETGALTLIDVVKGAGAELFCGAKAEINYDAFANGITFDSTKSKTGVSKPIIIQTGKNQVIKGLEAGIIGMKEGGKRKISIPPRLGFNTPGFENSIISKDEVVSYDVELVSIKEGPYKNNPGIEVKNETTGSGKNILCGDKVKIKYSLKQQDADTTGETEFILGSGNVPVGFEMAVANMKSGGRKTVVIPHDLLKTTDKNILKNIEFKKSEPIQADIEVIDTIAN